jgi:hypothetical protein
MNANALITVLRGAADEREGVASTGAVGIAVAPAIGVSVGRVTGSREHSTQKTRILIEQRRNCPSCPDFMLLAHFAG